MLVVASNSGVIAEPVQQSLCCWLSYSHQIRHAEKAQSMLMQSKLVWNAAGSQGKPTLPFSSIELSQSSASGDSWSTQNSGKPLAARHAQDGALAVSQLPAAVHEVVKVVLPAWLGTHSGETQAVLVSSKRCSDALWSTLMRAAEASVLGTCTTNSNPSLCADLQTASLSQHRSGAQAALARPAPAPALVDRLSRALSEAQLAGLERLLVVCQPGVRRDALAGVEAGLPLLQPCLGPMPVLQVEGLGEDVESWRLSDEAGRVCQLALGCRLQHQKPSARTLSTCCRDGLCRHRQLAGCVCECELALRLLRCCACLVALRPGCRRGTLVGVGCT